jgi:hypothetical protein
MPGMQAGQVDAGMWSGGAYEVRTCAECGARQGVARGWIMMVERAGNLVVLPMWNPKIPPKTVHFCGRAHASRYVDRWIGESETAPKPKMVTPRKKVAAFPVQRVESDAEKKTIRFA